MTLYQISFHEPAALTQPVERERERREREREREEGREGGMEGGRGGGKRRDKNRHLKVVCMYMYIQNKL